MMNPDTFLPSLPLSFPRSCKYPQPSGLLRTFQSLIVSERAEWYRKCLRSLIDEALRQSPCSPSASKLCCFFFVFVFFFTGSEAAERLSSACMLVLITAVCFFTVTDDSEEWACEDETLSPSYESQYDHRCPH